MPNEGQDVETQRELAAHAVEIEHMKKVVDDMVGQLRSVNDTLSQINKTLSEAKGGWKTLVYIGGASGIIGAALNHFLHSVQTRI